MQGNTTGLAPGWSRRHHLSDDLGPSGSDSLNSSDLDSSTELGCVGETTPHEQHCLAHFDRQCLFARGLSLPPKLHPLIIIFFTDRNTYSRHPYNVRCLYFSDLCFAIFSLIHLLILQLLLLHLLILLVLPPSRSVRQTSVTVNGWILIDVNGSQWVNNSHLC